MWYWLHKCIIYGGHFIPKPLCDTSFSSKVVLLPAPLLIKLNPAKYIFFMLIMLFLLLPGIQQLFTVYKIKELNGDFKKAEKPAFTVGGWLSNQYQKDEETWQNEQFGFRNSLVRIHNQIGFELYRKVYASDVLLGKEGYLFAQNYIDSYTGRDFSGDSTIREKIKLLKRVAEILQSNNISMICVLAPGKGSYFHEYIADADAQIEDTTNYEVFARLLRESGLDYIDFKYWFDQLKPHHPYALFPRDGIHWSSYGAVLAADSLIREIGTIRKIEIPKLIIDSVIMKEELSEVDNDVGRSLNLFLNRKTVAMPYARYHFESDSNKTKPRVMVVGDSYYWTLPTYDMRSQSFNGVNFLFYNKELHPMGPAMIPLDKVNLKELVLNSDIVILLCTEANLHDFDWHFSQDIIHAFKNDVNVKK